MNWYKTAQENDAPVNIPGYPYYIAQYRESRFKGAYPPGILGVPQLQKQWDRGDFGVGKTMRELRSENIGDLLVQLKMKSIDPQFDDVDFYEISRPNSPRRRLHWREVLEISRK